MFCKNRDRLLAGEIAAKFFVGVLKPAAGPKAVAPIRFAWPGYVRSRRAAWASYFLRGGLGPCRGGSEAM